MFLKVALVMVVVVFGYFEGSASCFILKFTFPLPFSFCVNVWLCSPVPRCLLPAPPVCGCFVSLCILVFTSVFLVSLSVCSCPCLIAFLQSNMAVEETQCAVCELTYLGQGRNRRLSKAKSGQFNTMSWPAFPKHVCRRVVQLTIIYDFGTIGHLRGGWFHVLK